MEYSMRITRSTPAAPHRTAARVIAGLLALALPLASRATAIADTQLPVGVLGEPYPVFSLTATGGTAPYTWSITAGALPAGLALQSNGLIAGTPTAAGSFSVTFQASGGG